MRIIQSYWACKNKELLTTQPNWLAPEYNLMSWALSCLQLKKYYKEVILYCDKETKALLIDELQLPYSEVICELDVLNSYPSGLWALPKIYVYGKQNEPFLHVDGDAFIWKAFNEKLISSNLVAQNLEHATVYYEAMWADLKSDLSFIPEEIANDRQSNNGMLAYNAGIFGGNDYNFFNFYSQKAFEFVNKNIGFLKDRQAANFNIFFEQYLFYCLVQKHNKTVSVLLNEIFGDNEYKGFGDFIDIPHIKQYLHILGNYKNNEEVCYQLANRLRLDYPKYYYRIISLYKKKKLKLKSDYYQNCKDFREDHLMSFSSQLKSDFKRGLLEKKNDERYNFQPLFRNIPKLLSQEMSEDLNSFYNRVEKIIKNKFTKISKKYLYGRDLNVTHSYEELFSSLDKIYSKQVESCNQFEIIKSNFDWSRINSSILVMEDRKAPDSFFLNLIVPECDQAGYSLANVDLLDIQILEILKTKKTVGRLLNECKKLFGKDDLENSKAEFEKLIFGRIKKGIHNKVIKIA